MLTEESSPPARARRGPGVRALLLAAGATAALHLLALGAGTALVDAPAPEPVVRASAVTLASAPAPLPAEAPAVAGERRPEVRRLTPRPASLGPAALAAPGAGGPSAVSRELSGAKPLAEQDIDVARSVHPAAAAVADPDMEDVPVYRTVLPPDARLHYEMQRGVFSGRGDLLWQRHGAAYEVRLQAEVAGIHVLTETSTGHIDAHGLAPERYTDSRARRGTQAANFQRDQGRITYSGPQVTHPLPPGTQDRLSWMVQIAAVLNAEPRHATPGARLVFFVSGARGDADVWAFRCVGVETVSAAQGPIHAVRFTREPRRVYDRQVDVWMSPAHHHLPVRARFTTSSGGEVFELLLRDIGAP